MTTEAPKRMGRKGIPNHPIEFRRKMAELASEPGVSVSRLAMAHGLNANLVFKWRRSLHAGEYDQVDLLPVLVETPPVKLERSTATPMPGTATLGIIEISIGAAKVRIEGTPDESTLLQVLSMLHGLPGTST